MISGVIDGGPTVGSGGGQTGLSAAGAAAGIAVAATLLVVLPVGVVLGYCGMWCLMRSRGKMATTVPGDREKKELAGAIYEEPAAAAAPVEMVFSLFDNQAYGEVNTEQRS